MKFGFQKLAFASLLALASCATTGPEVTRLPPAGLVLPPAKSFGPARVVATRRSNASIARDFMALAFKLESGRDLSVLSRFEGPVRVGLAGEPASAANLRDLDQLLSRLRTEAGIDIRRAAPGGPANVVVELVRGREMRRRVPQAACFVVPGALSWDDFLERRNTPDLDWVEVRERRRMAIFIPGDASDQEVRDCLNEELAQALGPVNDLFTLTDSVFNDDNFHTILTDFDILVLRAFYDPALHSGMSRAAVQAALPGILRRLHPADGTDNGVADNTTDEWRHFMELALGATARDAGRVRAARRAVQIAQQNRWHDHRLGFSLYALGRLVMSDDPQLALAAFAEADAIFRARPETSIHAAHVAAQVAIMALASADPTTAIGIVDANTAIAQNEQNAGLLASLLMVKAAALEALDRKDEAEAVRLDSLGWAGYAFADKAAIQERLSEIYALTGRR